MSKIKPVRARDLFTEMRREDSAMVEAERQMGIKLILARNLLRLRIQRGMTQSALAKAAGLRQPRIAEIEAARSNPQLETLDRIATALGVRVESLVNYRHAERNRRFSVSASVQLSAEKPVNGGWDDAASVAGTVKVSRHFVDGSRENQNNPAALVNFDG